MKKLTILFFLLTNSLLVSAQDMPYGACIGMDYIFGSGTYGTENGSIAGMNFFFRSVPSENKKITVGLSLQYCGGFQPRTFIGLDLIKKISMRGRLQPYFGARLGGGKIGEKTSTVNGKSKTEEDFRFIVSPMFGIEYFLGGKFSVDVSYKYDFMPKSPTAYDHLVFTGLKCYIK